MTKLEIHKLKSEVANCERVAKTADESLKKALLDRATTLQKQIAKAEKEFKEV